MQTRHADLDWSIANTRLSSSTCLYRCRSAAFQPQQARHNARPTCSRQSDLHHPPRSTKSAEPVFLVTESSPSQSQSYFVAPQSVTTTTAPAQRERNASNPLFALFLPEGFPETVAPDYLSYQLWSVPAHVTGWLSISLATSSLLNAVGLNPSPAGVTASAAAIKWLTKDGIGAAGKVVVGATRRLGLDFDDDPRRWRMIAEGITTVGLGLEIATSAVPQQFLLLASVGNFLKALGKGITLPVFRVIQTHQAVRGNVGPVAAKEELWEVVGQLSGYASSLAVLRLLESAGWQNWQSVASVWVGVQALHIWLRYIALSTLCFDSISHKRGCMLATAHVAGQQIPGVQEVNRLEPMLVDPRAMTPSMQFGCSVKAACGEDPNALNLMALLLMYEPEPYILTWRQQRAFVVLKDDYNSIESAPGLLQAMWQAAWLQQHAEGVPMSSLEVLAESLQHAREALPSFRADAQAAGWQVQNVVCNTGAYRVTVQHQATSGDTAVIALQATSQAHAEGECSGANTGLDRRIDGVNT